MGLVLCHETFQVHQHFAAGLDLRDSEAEQHAEKQKNCHQSGAKMKLHPLSLLCLSLLLFHLSMARRGGSFGKSFGFGLKKGSTPNRGNTNKNNQGSNSQAGKPRKTKPGSISSQADTGIQVVTPGSRLEATRTKQGAPMEEDT
ncbi:hypothetical protein NQZ68_034227 [Dissostichus eleginoides]|nr:hypothetical protein NQZ68_034227 [Dissostichus eleginoides]